MFPVTVHGFAVFVEEVGDLVVGAFVAWRMLLVFVGVLPDFWPLDGPELVGESPEFGGDIGAIGDGVGLADSLLHPLGELEGEVRHVPPLSVLDDVVPLVQPLHAEEDCHARWGVGEVGLAPDEDEQLVDRLLHVLVVAQQNS